MKSKYAFGGNEPFKPNTGCFIDGAYGNDHAIKVMVGLLQRVERATGDEAASKLIEEYDDETIDEEFADEWLDDATDVLQDNTAPGLVWEWEAGDLCLIDEEEPDAD